MAVNYVLIKRYNPIYDFFLFRYLKENGIDVNENVTLKEVERIAVSFQNKAAAALGQQPTREVGLKFSSELPQPERVLWYYAYSWKRQPDSRPSTSYSFEGIFGDKMPSTEQLKELEAQIPAGRGKLLFSKEEAAVEIVNFYKRYLRDPLRKVLNGSSIRRDFLKYFSHDQMNVLLSSPLVGDEKRDNAARTMAREALAWLDAMTPEKVVQDVERTLQEHWKDTEHIRFHGDEKKTKSCDHGSEYVEVTCYLNVQNDSENVSLQPARGYRVWVKHNWEPDYADVIFPQYAVRKLES